jgi:hypothetical protein
MLTLPLPKGHPCHNKPLFPAPHHDSSLYMAHWGEWLDLTRRTPEVWAWSLELQFQALMTAHPMAVYSLFHHTGQR